MNKVKSALSWIGAFVYLSIVSYAFAAGLFFVELGLKLLLTIDVNLKGQIGSFIFLLLGSGLSYRTARAYWMFVKGDSDD